LFGHGVDSRVRFLGATALALFRPSRSWHKTSKEMNAPLRLFSSTIFARPASRLLACAAVGSMLAGCMGGNPFATAPVDPTSPVAAEVAKTARASGEYPTFADIPPVPKDQRPLQAWGRSADQLEAEGAKLERETADSTWTLKGTESFAARAKRQVGEAPASEESTTAASEAFARQIRERATPPPSPR
jgi:hypothetical protein